MRRNRNTSRGDGGNLNRSSDPFLSDHLKDIDLELDLLKRKREMLEQQQLIQPLMPQRSFNQQPYYLLEPKQSGSNRDFSHMNNSGSQHNRKSYGRKRQSDSDWQHNSNPKRSAGQGQRSGSSFAGPSSNRNQRSYGGQNQQTKSTPYKYGQGQQFISQKINKQKQQRPSKNYVINKVTKATKAFVPPNKLASQPVADRNKLVAAAIMSVAEVETLDREGLRLLPDEVPTKQITGRLELALGAVLRDIREKCAESSHHVILHTTSLQRVIKQAIRERIKSAMLGKIVGTTQEIIKEYRSMYPKDTDIEIVNIALEAGGIKPDKDPKPIVLEKERPDEYFKVNMIKLIDIHLQEMFNKVEKLYEAENIDESSQGVLGEGKIETNNEPVGESAKETVVSANEENVTAANNGVEATEIVANTTTEKDGNFIAANDEIVPTTNNETIAVTNTESLASTDNVNVVPCNVEQLFPHANAYKRMLPRLLKRHIPTILKLLHLNKMYKNAVADISTTTRAKFVEYGKPDDSSSMETSEPSQIPKKFAPYVGLPYYVKIMGRPQLPKKKVMNTFLEVFHPKSIKKHRSIHNLLFIGFTEKSDFDAIVEADGTCIGRSTLSIRVCDKNIGKPKDNPEINTASSRTDQNFPRSHDPHYANRDVNIEPADGDKQGNDLEGQVKDSVEKKADVGIKSENLEDEKVGENIQGATDKENAVEDTHEVPKNTDDLKNTDVIVKDTSDLVKDTEIIENADRAENIESKDEVKAEPQKKEPAIEEKKVAEVDEKDDQLAEANGEQPAVDEKSDVLPNKKSSTRLANTPATPSTIRTRRASRLLQN